MLHVKLPRFRVYAILLKILNWIYLVSTELTSLIFLKFLSRLYPKHLALRLFRTLKNILWTKYKFADIFKEGLGCCTKSNPEVKREL